MIAIAAAVRIEIEIAIAETAIAIATYGVTGRGIRAATAVRAASIREIIAMKLTRAGLRIRASRTATPAFSAASRLAKIKGLVKTKDLAKIKERVRSSRLARSRRLVMSKHLAPVMKPSDLPTTAASAASAVVEVGVAAAVADVTAARTPRTAQVRISLQAKVRATT